MPFLAFEDTIAILSLTFLFFGSAAVVLFAVYRGIRYRRISLRLAVIAAMALMLFSLILIRGGDGGFEVNPLIESKAQLIGVYSNGDKRLDLRADGTYGASGLSQIADGTWSHYDWNLHLSNSDLDKPRIIFRSGHLYIAPYYVSNGPVGLVLKRE